MTAMLTRHFRPSSPLLALALPLTFALFAALVGGCQLAQPSQPVDFYLLGQAEPIPEAAPAGTSDPVPGGRIVIAEIAMPAYLERREIALRRSAVEVEYRALAFWAEPLSEGIHRELRRALATLTGQTVVSDTLGLTEADRQLFVTFERFDAQADGVAVLEAQLTVRSAGLTRHRDFSAAAEINGVGVAAEAEALSRLLHRLAEAAVPLL